MARAALGFSRDDLAVAAGLSGSTVVRFEGDQAVARESVAAMQSALESAGVEFIPAGATIRAGGGASGEGVRLRSR
jgi:transcriptional regulator with XRE-family HTH domain